jgi:Rad3-related DNA helicase
MPRVTSKMPPVTKIVTERMAIMETVSQRLEEATARLGDVADGLRTNIAVHEERLKNQDKLIEEIRQTAREHQQSDLNAHTLMNEKLDKIKSSLDVLSGRNDPFNNHDFRNTNEDQPQKMTVSDKINSIIDKWKYWFYAGIFVAGAIAHKAELFDYIEKVFTGHS